jgi:hypothetical protein
MKIKVIRVVVISCYDISLSGADGMDIAVCNAPSSQECIFVSFQNGTVFSSALIYP